MAFWSHYPCVHNTYIVLFTWLSEAIVHVSIINTLQSLHGFLMPLSDANVLCVHNTYIALFYMAFWSNCPRVHNTYVFSHRSWEQHGLTTIWTLTDHFLHLLQEKLVQHPSHTHSQVTLLCGIEYFIKKHLKTLLFCKHYGLVLEQ